MTAFDPERITRQNVIDAIKEIDQNELPLRPSTGYDVVYNGKKYPPKELLRHAYVKATGELNWEGGPSGGEPTNKYFRRLGFEIIEKNKNSLGEAIQEIRDFSKKLWEASEPSEESKKKLVTQLNEIGLSDRLRLFDNVKKPYDKWLLKKERDTGNQEIRIRYEVAKVLKDNVKGAIDYKELEKIIGTESKTWYKIFRPYFLAINFKPNLEGRNVTEELFGYISDSIIREIGTELDRMKLSFKYFGIGKRNGSSLLHFEGETRIWLSIFNKEHDGEKDTETTAKQLFIAIENGKICYGLIDNGQIKYDLYHPNMDKIKIETLESTDPEQLITYFKENLDKILNMPSNANEPKTTFSANNEDISLNTILYGPPGTGKTYSTIDLAVKIASPDYVEGNHESNKAIYDELIKTGQIVFTTFHQSLNYEDFIEGIKPDTINGQVVYSVKPGIFQMICSHASEKHTSSNFLDAYDKFTTDLIENGDIELVTKTQQKPFSVGTNSMKSCVVKPHTEKKTEMSITRDIIREYVLNDLITDWKPYTPAIGEYLKTTYKVQVSNTDNTQQNYVLIIDEINRGNVSQIFGELITLIEEDKRFSKQEALEVTLPYSKKSFGVPNNLYIIGTMNTADRSVEALDTALRRRFSFVEMTPRFDLPELDRVIGNISLNTLLLTINYRIEKLLNKDHLIGHSYFMSANDMRGIKEIFQNKIIPLLQEYFFGDYGKIGLVLGEGFFEEEELKDNIFADFKGYDGSDYSDKPIYKVTDVSKMDDEKFREAISRLLKR